MVERNIHDVISYMEQVRHVVCFLQDTRSMVGHPTSNSNANNGYKLVWDWVKEKLDKGETLLYNFLGDYKHLIDQMEKFYRRGDSNIYDPREDDEE